MKHVRTTALLAATFLLSACGGVSGQAAPTAPAASTPASASPESSTAAAAPVGDVTKPGTELKVGERAVVPFKYGTNKSGTIAITVTAIEKGDNADLAKYGTKAKGITPYYLRATVENVDGADLSFASVSLRALGADGRSTGVIITGGTDRCKSGNAGKDFKSAGAKFETCVLQGAGEGSTVDAATFDKGDGYDKSPVVWK
jgi:predicted small secreted protein